MSARLRQAVATSLGGPLFFLYFCGSIEAIMNKGPVSQFIEHHYRHFNAAALMDAAKGYETHLLEGGKMMVTLAGAMSTAELGISLAEMIRQGKVDIISCTGANLEEDVMNLVA
jgi:deoxyhypusine synthase